MIPTSVPHLMTLAEAFREFQYPSTPLRVSQPPNRQRDRALTESSLRRLLCKEDSATYAVAMSDEPDRTSQPAKPSLRLDARSMRGLAMHCG